MNSLTDYLIFFDKSFMDKKSIKKFLDIEDVFNKKIIKSTDIYSEIQTNGKSKNYSKYIIYFEQLEIASVKLNKKQIKKIKEYLSRKSISTNFKIRKVNKKQTKKIKYNLTKFNENWGLKYLKLENEIHKGEGINVAIIDSGIDLEHPDFKNEIPKKNRFNSIDKTNDIQDYYGHGTHVAGILFGKSKLNNDKQYGVVPHCNKFIVKSLSRRGYILNQIDVTYGIDWALWKGCKIINLSAGFQVSKKEGIDVRLNKIIEKTWERGCFVVAAVGNDSSRDYDPEYNNLKPIHKPANCPKAIAVSAIDKNSKIYKEANSSIYENQNIDFVAPGEAIISSFPKTIQNGEVFQYAKLDGTSMATPFVSGILAIYCQKYPDKSIQQIYNMLVNSKNTARPFNSDYGFGIPKIY